MTTLIAEYKSYIYLIFKLCTAQTLNTFLNSKVVSLKFFLFNGYRKILNVEQKY